MNTRNTEHTGIHGRITQQIIDAIELGMARHRERLLRNEEKWSTALMQARAIDDEPASIMNRSNIVYMAKEAVSNVSFHCRRHVPQLLRG